MDYTRYRDTRTSLEDSELGQTNAKTFTLAETFQLTIIFNNGRIFVVDSVEDYGLCATNTDVFWFKKDGFKNFMPKDGVVYFGRREGLSDKDIRPLEETSNA